MNREEIKAFTLRVTEANSCDLIVILYDVVLCDIKNAKKAYGYPAACDLPGKAGSPET